MKDAVKLRLLSACFALVMLGWMALNVSLAQDDPDPVFMPALLEDGLSIQDELGENISARLYAFNASQGDRVSLHMRGDFDTYLVLLGSGGELLAYNDDADEGSAIEDAELPYTGRYYVLATTFTHIDGILLDDLSIPAPLEYELTMTGNTQPSEADLPPLDATPVLEGQAAQRSLSETQPIGLFTFEAEAGDVVNLSAASETIYYLLVHVFAPDGSRVALTHDPEYEPISALELPADGQYLVMTMDAFFVDRLLPNAGDYGLGDVNVTIQR